MEEEKYLVVWLKDLAGRYFGCTIHQILTVVFVLANNILINYSE
jgi:hypothetical protein